jgi:glycosyl transferase family 4
MRQHAVLIFAYHFPPDLQIGAARPFRFYKYLSRLGYDCKVITAAPQADARSNGVTYVPDPFVGAPRGGFQWQLERAIRRGLVPGAVGLGWSRNAIRAAREIIRKAAGTRVTVISTFPPLGVHLAAWRLAREEGLPWIADFRDPLCGFPLNGVAAYQKRIRNWLEKKVIRAADAVIANTDASQQKWQQQHPDRADIIHLLWNGFDPECRISAKPLPIRGPRVLSHMGELYGDRNAGPILASIDRLIEGHILPPGAVRLRLVGPAEPAMLGAREVLERAQAQGWLELTARFVPQHEAREIIQTSDYLLLVQPQSIIQVPAKLYEYLQIGRPILAYVKPNSPTERILVGSGVPHRCVHPEDSPDRMDQVIAEFLRLPTEITPASPWFQENFNGEVQTHTLAAIIDKTTTTRTGKPKQATLMVSLSRGRAP